LQSALFLAELEGVPAGDSFWTVGKHSGAAGMSGGVGPGRAGNPSPNNGLGDAVSFGNVIFLKRCSVCGQMHIRSGATCSRECRMMMAEFEEFSTLQFILENSRWAGAPSQEELRGDYFRERMWEAVERLPISADVLGEMLIEILVAAAS